MNDDTPFTATGDEALEARIVAWVAGEASAFEVAELERLCAERAELEVFRRRMVAMETLLKGAASTVTAETWNLPPEKRAKIEELGGLVRLVEKAPRNTFSFLRVVAAVVILGGALMFLAAPTVIRQRKTPAMMAAREKSLDFMPSGGGGGAPASQERETLRTPASPAPTAMSRDFAKKRRSEIVLPESEGSSSLSSLGSLSGGMSGGLGGSGAAGGWGDGKEEGFRRSAEPGNSDAEPSAVAASDPFAGKLGDLAQSDEKPADVADAPARPSPVARPTPMELAKNERAGGQVDLEKDSRRTTHEASPLQERPEVPAKPAAEEITDRIASSEGRVRYDDIGLSNPALAADHDRNVDQVRRSLYQAEGNYNLGKYKEARKFYEDTLRVDPYNVAARRGMERVSQAQADYYRAAYDHTRAALLKDVDAAWESQVPEETEKERELKNLVTKGKKLSKQNTQKPVAPSSPQLAPPPTDEVSAAEEPFSTFSLNVSDASFQIARAALAKGEQPEPAGIKVEQFYNAVDYGDPAPAAGEPVAVKSEQAAHPIIPGRTLVRVAARVGSEGRTGKPLRLTLLVDQSGSMVREDRKAAFAAALDGLKKLLTARDSVTVIGFSRTPRLVVENLPGDQAGRLAAMIHQEASEGGTNLEEAMKAALEKAAAGLSGQAASRIVLFTDGAANLGDADPDRLADVVKTMRQRGIGFDVAGIGADELNDRLLGELARHGNGRYQVVDAGGAESFAGKLAGAFRPAAENVKVQVKFNPARVARYKLIGFEKERLKKEDFRNDAVDAAELAAEEAGVAIYQVETLPDGNGELGEVFVRFRDTADGQMVERSWSLPYESRVPALDQAAPSMRLAVLAMLAGEKLKGGPLAEAIDFRELRKVMESVRAEYRGSNKVAAMLEMTEHLQK